MPLISTFAGGSALGVRSRGPGTPTYAVTPAAGSINEGSALTINVSGTNIIAGTYYWTVTNSGDFTTSSGSFSIAGNAGSFTITPTDDYSTEGSETFTVSIRSGSIGGTVLATSSSITINDTSLTPAANSQSYTTGGTYAWVCPAGITNVSIVAIGPGGGGGVNWPNDERAGAGGGLGYKNNFTVIPGVSYTVVVGTFSYTTGVASYFANSTATIVSGGAGNYSSGGTYVGDGGGNGGPGGSSAYNYNSGGGGAGGYSGTGGQGGGNYTNGYAGGGGAGGGGANGNTTPVPNNGGFGRYNNGGGGGGGTGLFGGTGSGGGGSYPRGGGGQGSLGNAGNAAPWPPTPTSYGAGANYYAGGGGQGGDYGGGGGGPGFDCDWGIARIYGSSRGGKGAVRIVWPGTTRQFPSTGVGAP